jgi:hypothetical protein
MALVFTPYAKGAGGFLTNFREGIFFGYYYSYVLRIYPSTVSMPTSTTVSDALPAGYILSFARPIQTNIVMSGNSIVYSGTARSSTTTAAGTLSWFAFANDSDGNSPAYCCDSVSLPGGGGVLVLSALTVTSGQAVSWSGFNLTMV